MNLQQQDLEKLADILYCAELQGETCSPVRDALGVDDIPSACSLAYRVQQINVERAIKAGRRVVGRKIGLTSKAVQAQLGVDQPDYGAIFADMLINDGEDIPYSRVLQPRVEAEIALILGADIDMPQPTIFEVISAVAYALPAIEVVGSRIQSWDIRIADTIADNASCGVVVLGNEPALLSEIDLRLCGMAMDKGAEPVSVGAGAACLGSPLISAQWLAKKMVELDQPLKAGDLIFTGALGPMVNVEPGDCFEARISGVGSVRACFGETV